MSESFLIGVLIGLIIYLIVPSEFFINFLNAISTTEWYIICLGIIIYLLCIFFQDEIKRNKKKKDRETSRRFMEFYDKETKKLKDLLEKNPNLWKEKSIKLEKLKEKYAPSYY